MILLLNFGKREGVDLQNPTPEMVEEFFKDRNYYPRSIQREMFSVMVKDIGDDANIPRFILIELNRQYVEDPNGEPLLSSTPNYKVRKLTTEEQKERFNKVIDVCNF